MKKHCFILGTRPEIIKLYSCIVYCEEHNIDYFIIHTNQHYSENMDQVFFDELKIPQPKYNLWINGWSHASMTASMMTEIEKILLSESPDIVYVQWDTNSVLAGWITASKMNIQVSHIEAGLRSYDRSMPEEINRVLVDHVSSYLFAPTMLQRNILLWESISDEQIHVVGNTIVDAVMIVKNNILPWYNGDLEKYWCEKGEYILFTMHRPSNVDTMDNIKDILEAVQELMLISWKKILFPIHPRTHNNIKKFGLESLLENIIVIEPVGFIENIFLQTHAHFIITDSGGIQEESCILQKKTIVLRENTERPETLDVGGAVLTWSNRQKIIKTYKELIDKEISWYNPFWDGTTWEQIFKITAL